MKLAMCKNESCEFNDKCYRYINNYQHISKSKDSKIFEIKDFDKSDTAQTQDALDPGIAV